MHQTDTSIIERSNISSDTLIINQCNKNDYTEFLYKEKYRVRMISTTERGLSRSRNMAIKNATGDICLICDDDAEFVESYKTIIEDAYILNPKADIIAFALIRKNKIFPNKDFRVSYISALKISSVQISFKREDVLNKGVLFDVTMGSGTGNGGGEENKFLYECLKNKLKIYYQPQVIANVGQSESHWFHGYTLKYFIDKGWAFKKINGKFIGLLIGVRFTIVKYPLYKEDINFINALCSIIQGFFQKR